MHHSDTLCSFSQRSWAMVYPLPTCQTFNTVSKKLLTIKVKNVQFNQFYVFYSPPTVSPPADPPTELGYCPSGWLLWQGHCYQFLASQTPASWDEAQYTCQLDMGSHVAYLHSDEEVEWVAEWARLTWGAGTLWTGMRRDYESGMGLTKF